MTIRAPHTPKLLHPSGPAFTHDGRRYRAAAASILRSDEFGISLTFDDVMSPVDPDRPELGNVLWSGTVTNLDAAIALGVLVEVDDE